VFIRVNQNNPLNNPLKNWNPSKPGIGIMLKINKNMLIFLVRFRRGKYFDFTFPRLIRRAAPSQNIKLTAGPAKAVIAYCKEVALPLIDT